MKDRSDPTHLFYQHFHAATRISSKGAQSIFRAGQTPLATTGANEQDRRCLAVDASNSAQSVVDPKAKLRVSYTPYGHSLSNPALLVAYAGERFDTATGCFHLGRGYRAFSAMRMRFNSPDSFAPFRVLNSYSYCDDDPINHTDPTGHIGVEQRIRRMQSEPWPTSPEVFKSERVTRFKRRVQSQPNVPSVHSPQQSPPPSPATVKKMESALTSVNTFYESDWKLSEMPSRDSLLSKLDGLYDSISTGESYNNASGLKAVKKLKKEVADLKSRLKTFVENPARPELEQKTLELRRKASLELKTLGYTLDYYSLKELKRRYQASLDQSNASIRTPI